MRERRKFTVAFKRQVVEELLSRASTIGQLSRRLDVSSGLVLHWKKRYEEGGLTDGPSGNEKELRSRVEQLERMVGADDGERSFKKGRGVHRAAEKREFVAHHGEEFGSIQRGCEVMGLGRSTYYYQSKAASVEDRKEEADLRDRIEQIVVEHARYGYRRVRWQLKREGWEVNHKRVARIMRQESLQCQLKRRWVKTTDSDHGYRVYPNRLKGVKVSRPNQVWVADITYIRIVVGFLYLAVVLDLYSRKVIGWALSDKIDAELSVEALRMALEQRGAVTGCIHYSDRGVQYACQAYVDELQAAGLEISMSRKGNPYDNAAAESFMKTLKCEEVYLWDYQTVEDVKERVPYFLEEVYNQKRLHSALGFCPPTEYERAWQRGYSAIHPERDRRL